MSLTATEHFFDVQGGSNLKPLNEALVCDHSNEQYCIFVCYNEHYCKRWF